MTLEKIPTPDAQLGLQALRAMLRERHPLAALQVFHAGLGDIFRINLPGFTPVVMVGPQAARYVLVQARSELRWRNEDDPVTHLLRHGVLVEDGDEHDALRHALSPPLHRQMLTGYVQMMWQCTQQVVTGWPQEGTLDLLVEMRKIALLILMRTLCQVDFTPQLTSLWNSVLGCIHFISPGLWMVWRSAPRLHYHSSIEEMDGYLYQIIAERRKMLAESAAPPADMLGLLIHSGMQDELVRDQLLTMLIAGHDTVTALMAWTLYLLGSHPDEMEAVRQEAQSVLNGRETVSFEQINQLQRLEWVIKEALRLYPPIHLGSRRAAADLDYNGYLIPRGERVIYSIYLTQRHPDYWPDPDRFDPQRHAPGNRQLPYAWLAFGGGPRNCIGAAFGQLEARLVLASILQNFEMKLVEKRVIPYMGATLEPRPGVRMRVCRRTV